MAKIEIDRDGPFISIYNAYDIKDKLKKQGFHFDGIFKCWRKEIRSKEELLNLCKLLKGKKVRVLGGGGSVNTAKRLSWIFSKRRG